MTGFDRTGPTGDFPRGKLNKDDEGGINIAIGPEEGCVRIDFGTPTAWIALPPEQAVVFAATIAKHAAALLEQKEQA